MIKCANTKLLVVFTLILVLGGAPLWAQDSAAPKTKKKELPKSGSLSSSGTLANGAHAIGLPWGASDPIRGGAPISGSVSKLDDKQWTLKLFNNSKDTYDVNLSVQQFNDRRVRVKTDHYSYRLGPKEKTQRQVSSGVGTAFAELSLDSWKKTAAAPGKEALAQQQQLDREAIMRGEFKQGSSAKPTAEPEQNPEEYLGNMGYQGN